MKTMASALFVFMVAPVLSAIPAKAPPAPPGYEWRNCEKMKAKFLVPEGWNFLEERQGAAVACFISKEKIEPGKEFETGLSVNLVPDVLRKTGSSPSEYAQIYLDRQASKGSLLDRSSAKQSSFELFQAEQIVRETDWPALRFRHLVVASPSLGRIYILLFETREDLWARYWPVIEPVFRSLRFEEGSADGTAGQQAAETEQNTVVTGAGWAGGQAGARQLKFAVPAGWQADAEAVRKHGVYAVLVPEGKTIETSSASIVVVYQRKDPNTPGLDTVENFNANNLRNMRETSPRGLWTAPWRPSSSDFAGMKAVSLEIYPKEGNEPAPMRVLLLDAGDGFFAVTAIAATREGLNRPEYDAFFNTLVLE